MADNNRWQEIDPFGRPFDVERAQSPTIGGIDPMMLLPQMRAARGVSRGWQALGPAAGQAAQSMWPAFPLFAGFSQNWMGNKSGRDDAAKDLWENYLQPGYGDQRRGTGSHAARNMRQQWFGPNPLTSLPGTPY